MTIKTILNVKGRAVETVRPETTVDEATRRMRSKRIGALVVVDGDGRIAGIVSDRGLLWELVDRGVAVLQEPLSKVMTKQVVTCAEDDEVIAGHVERVKGEIARLIERAEALRAEAPPPRAGALRAEAASSTGGAGA